MSSALQRVLSSTGAVRAVSSRLTALVRPFSQNVFSHHGKGVSIKAVYQGDLRCEATHGPSKTKMFTDAPVDNQGKGAVFSPTDLVATGLVTCMMTIMGINARKLKVDVKGMEITVTKEMSKSLPRRIARLPVTIKFPMELTEDQKRSLVRAANYCPVRESLRQDIDSVAKFVWADGTVDTVKILP